MQADRDVPATADELVEYATWCDEQAAAARRAWLEAKYVAIADFRDAHGMSFADVAEVLGVSRARAQQLVDEGKAARVTERSPKGHNAPLS